MNFLCVNHLGVEMVKKKGSTILLNGESELFNCNTHFMVYKRVTLCLADTASSRVLPIFPRLWISPAPHVSLHAELWAVQAAV